MIFHLFRKGLVVNGSASTAILVYLRQIVSTFVYLRTELARVARTVYAVFKLKYYNNWWNLYKLYPKHVLKVYFINVIGVSAFVDMNLNTNIALTQVIAIIREYELKYLFFCVTDL